MPEERVPVGYTVVSPAAGIHCTLPAAAIPHSEQAYSPRLWLRLTIGATDTTPVSRDDLQRRSRSGHRTADSVWFETDDGDLWGDVSLEWLELAWTDATPASLPDPCPVTVELKFDPGRTGHRSGTDDETHPQSTVSTVPGTEIDVDYTGRVRAPGGTVDFPVPIRAALPGPAGVILRLDTGDPRADVGRPSNVVCVSTAGEVAWTAPARTGEDESGQRFNSVWWHNDRLLCYTRGFDMLYQVLEPETGQSVAWIEG